MEEKTIIITGASRGLGAAVARHAGRLQARVVINARSERPLQELAADVASGGVPVEVVAGDLCDERVCLEVVSRAVSRFGRIDAVVNNAGVLDPLARLEDVNPSEWETSWRLNVLAPMYLTSLALPHLRKVGGRVINISSGAAEKAYTGWAAYCSTKASLNICTEVLAVEEPEVTALSVRPGLVDTAMQERVRTRGAGVMTESDHRRFLEAHESGRLVSPDEAGRAVAILALFAKPEWSGDVVTLDEDRVSKLVASKRSTPGLPS
jgi:NAD(P)-dependent dehydrogenase (short-subunit alcohol dehydrogenase family)